MKKVKIKKIKFILLILLLGFCTYASHDWYWTVYSWIHPDVSRMYENKYKNLSDEELRKILKQRPSPKTNGALFVLQDRYEKSKDKKN